MGVRHRSMSSRHALLPSIVVLISLSGCAVGPDYRKPDTPAPAAWAEPGPWKVSAPRDHLPKGEWWTVYNDPVLDRLAAQATAASPTIRAALARRDQARALARIDSSALYPQLDVNAEAERGRTAPNRRTGASAYTDNTFTLPLDLSYELDLWGRVRRLDEGARARAAASEADYHNVLLGVQADVARTYFSLRALDAERALVARNVESRRRSLQIVQQRHALGASGLLDTSLAETELATSEDSLIEIDRNRTALRHALAVLCGQLPEGFELDEDPAAALAAVPAIPLGLPSELLERRPDVASAERGVAAANAGIGVAKAAFFPTITLFGSAGYSSNDLDSLLSRSSREWSLGPGISLPIFHGGRNTAGYRQAMAVWEEALANYRQSVLVAFQEVETTLSDLRRLGERGVVIDRAVVSSRRAATLVLERYRAGQVGYLDVTDAERTAIVNERAAVQLRGRQLVSSVILVKALGGGW
ncbi:efflux transporter, outer membrane factor lipoprotein, NodT family [Opitutaceae bacterium TAV1]|nr:efflux transporter, outer membrane factor lipoprotein, NodT family [Opitutaceae bacterium TAV1]